VQTAAPFVSLELARGVGDERGQDFIEYALLCGLIAAAIIVVLALGVMTGAVTGVANGIADCADFDTATNCGPFS